MPAVIIHEHPGKKGEDEITIFSGSGARKPRFRGVTNVSVRQGETFDLTDGVHAYDETGSEVPFTVTPNTIDTCIVGAQTFTYSALGGTLTKTRTITVLAIGLPTIYGNTAITTFVNTDIDPLDGLWAEDGNGDSIPVSFDETVYTLTKTADGTDATADYVAGTTVTLAPPELPPKKAFVGWYTNSSYSGAPVTSITINADTHVYAKINQYFTLTKTIGDTDYEEDYLEATTAPLPAPTVGERKRFDGWYEDSAYSGTAINSIFMNSDKHVYAKVVKQVAYAHNASGVLTFTVEDEGAHDGDSTYYTGWESAGTCPWNTGQPYAQVFIDDVIKPTKCTSWFSPNTYSSVCQVTSITGLENIDTSNCTMLNKMFSGAYLSGSLDLSMWDVRKVTSTQEMFRAATISTVNLTGWRLEKISTVRTSNMFGYMANLTTIYADWNGANWGQANLFTNSTNLVGGNGTAYNSSNISSDYARPDNPPTYPGYFTRL